MQGVVASGATAGGDGDGWDQALRGHIRGGPVPPAGASQAADHLLLNLLLGGEEARRGLRASLVSGEPGFLHLDGGHTAAAR